MSRMCCMCVCVVCKQVGGGEEKKSSMVLEWNQPTSKISNESMGSRAPSSFESTGLRLCKDDERLKNGTSQF